MSDSSFDARLIACVDSRLFATGSRAASAEVSTVSPALHKAHLAVIDRLREVISESRLPATHKLAAYLTFHTANGNCSEIDRSVGINSSEEPSPQEKNPYRYSESQYRLISKEVRGLINQSITAKEWDALSPGYRRALLNLELSASTAAEEAKKAGSKNP